MFAATGSDVELAVAAAQAGAAVVLGRYETTLTRFGKPGGDFATDGHLTGSVHFAAGIALCRAAGCVVTGLDGQPVHSGACGLVAAADQQTHAALMEMIAAQ